MSVAEPGRAPDGPTRWLHGAARRERLQQFVADCAWTAAALLLLGAAYLALARAIDSAVVVAALLPLFALAAGAVLITLALRRFRRIDLARVAAAADARAMLHDDLLSALALGDAAGRDGFVDLHLRRAERVAARLDLTVVFPLAVPRRALLVAAVALVVALAAAALPGPERPAAQASGATPAAMAAAPGAAGASAADEVGQATPEGGKHGAAALWKQVEALASALGGSGSGQSLAQAIATRDARAATRALEALQEKQLPGAGEQQRREAPDEQVSAELAKGILERLSELIKAGEGAAGGRPAAAPSDGTTARLDSELRAEQEDAQRGAPRQQSAGEDALNTLMRGLSRSSSGGRDMVHGEADSAEGAGRANVGGGAMGRRVGMSTGGAGEGDQPGANVTPLPGGDSIFGRRTERLAVQLRTTRMPEARNDHGDDAQSDQGTEESFFAATRAQAARTGLQSVATGTRSAAEGVSQAERPPVELAEAVKRYTLARHRRERAASPDGTGER